MREIPTIFVRDANDRGVVTSQPPPARDWGFPGGGGPTPQEDGPGWTYDGDRCGARREVKPDRPTPDGFVLVETDPTTGKSVGWEPVEQSAFAKFHAEAVRAGGPEWHTGSYELVGPKVNGNPERATGH